MQGKRAVRVFLGCVLIAVTSSVVPAQAEPFHHLTPGKLASLRERVPVNVVFVGIDPTRIDHDVVETSLPASYRPILRGATFVRGKPQRLGLSYTYDYRIRYASSSYNDAFFGYLARAAKPAPVTHWQSRYNAQPGRRDIEANHAIDAPSVERWLAAHPPDGVDTAQNTIFLIDWFGRKDFRHHVYTKEREADSSWGPPRPYENPDVDAFVAWGGTAADDPEDGRGRTRRVWFYDLSAGPDHWAGNWDVIGTKQTPIGRLDQSRIIPPSWEYASDGMRAPVFLSEDLAAITRYIGIDLLFTPSPLYPAITTARGHPSSIDLDMNFYDVPGTATTADGSPETMLRTFRALAPWTRFSADVAPADFADPEHLSCFVQWSTLPLVSDESPPCYPDERYTAEANLFLFHSRNRTRFFGPDAGYDAGAFIYRTPGQGGICYAYADDDRLTGTQSFVFAFIGPPCHDLGWSDLMIHEYGHHVGLSHPHDGYDAEEDKHLSPGGEFAFVYAGTEVNSVMAYNQVNNEFSQFDVDNMARWATEAFVTSANSLAQKLLRAKVGSASLRSADELVGEASRAISAHRYRDAADAARRAYMSLTALARKAGVDVAAQPPGASPTPERRTADGSADLPLWPALDRLCGTSFCR